IVINKFERKGSEDAKRQVQKQYQRSHMFFDKELDEMPVYGTIASQFNGFELLSFHFGFIKYNEWKIWYSALSSGCFSWTWASYDLSSWVSC
ncbi:hypothetical protein, partial [Bacillus sp. ISL-39]|uniref:hypothetical protein n=1 Tax=Bacillus sp. ISL-39 TaxID=2819124 RepID=UPI00203539D8